MSQSAVPIPPPPANTAEAVRTRRLRALKLGVPPAVYLGAVVGAYFSYGWPRFVEWIGFLNGYLVLPFGREITIPLMIMRGFSPAEAVALVVLVDFIAASFIAWNLDLSRQMPYLGAFISRVERTGASLRRDHPSVEALGIAGLFLWTVKPGRGSGGATSAILGKVVFLETRWMLPTIVAACLVGCTLVALATVSALSLPTPLLALVGGALLVAVAALYLWRIRASLAGKLTAARGAILPGNDK